MRKDKNESVRWEGEKEVEVDGEMARDPPSVLPSSPRSVLNLLVESSTGSLKLGRERVKRRKR